MQERNFERQVKQRLEEFDIPPSAPVWQKVEREIRRRKERRRLVLWLLPFLLAGGAFLLWTISGNDNTTVSAVTTSTQPSPNQAVPQNEPVGKGIEKNNITTGNSAKSQENYTATSSEKSKSIPLDQEETGHKADLISKSKSQKTTTARKTSGQQRPVSQQDQLVPGNKDISTEVTEAIAPPIASTETTEAPSHDADSSANVTAKELRKETEKQPATKPAAEPVKSMEKKEEKNKEDKKWKIALHGSAGYAESAESFFPLIGAAETNVVPTSVGFAPNPTPSPLRKGLYGAFGLQFTRPLSNRLSFTTGIQYSYASTQQMVGYKRKRDSLTTRLAAEDEEYTFYNDRTNNFTNSYHYIEVPAGIDVKLFPSLPIELHAGFSLSALISGDALHYDRISNTYYRNNEQLRKTGINWFSGFSYGLMKNKLKLGPHIQYGIQSLNSTDSTNKKHLLMAGLRVKWMLK